MMGRTAFTAKRKESIITSVGCFIIARFWLFVNLKIASPLPENPLTIGQKRDTIEMKKTKNDIYVSYAMGNKLYVVDTGDKVNSESLSTYYKATQINKAQAIEKFLKELQRKYEFITKEK